MALKVQVSEPPKVGQATTMMKKVTKANTQKFFGDWNNISGINKKEKLPSN